MTKDPYEGWSRGRLVGVNRPTRPPVEVDCSEWDSEIPAEKWSRGRLVSVTQSLPLAEGEFEPAPDVHLLVVLQLAPGVVPAKVFLLAAQLIEAVREADPGLRLSYDFDASRTDAGIVTIALTPATPTDAEARLQAIAEVVRGVAAEFREATLNDVRLARAA
jgi:hypothetical protein